METHKYPPQLMGGEKLREGCVTPSLAVFTFSFAFEIT